MGKREELNRHHTIRHTGDLSPRRKLSPIMMMLIIVAAMMAVTALSTRRTQLPAASQPASVPSAPAPQRERLFELAAQAAAGEWGPEAADSCVLLTKAFAQAEDANAAAYLSLLANADAGGEEAQKLIAALTDDPVQADVLQKALSARANASPVS